MEDMNHITALIITMVDKTCNRDAGKGGKTFVKAVKDMDCVVVFDHDWFSLVKWFS